MRRRVFSKAFTSRGWEKVLCQCINPESFSAWTTPTQQCELHCAPSMSVCEEIDEFSYLQNPFAITKQNFS